MLFLQVALDSHDLKVHFLEQLAHDMHVLIHELKFEHHLMNQ